MGVIVKNKVAYGGTNFLDILSLITPMNSVILYNGWCSANILGEKEVILNLLISEIGLTETGEKEILTIPSQYTPSRNIRISAVFLGGSGEEAGYGHIDIQSNGIVKINCTKYLRTVNWAHVNVTYLI